MALLLPGPGSQQEDPQSSVSAAEEQAMHSVPQAASQVHESSAPFHSIPDSSMPGPDFSPQGMQQTLRMMRQNPALMEQMRTTFASMTPEQMQAAVSPFLLHTSHMPTDAQLLLRTSLKIDAIQRMLATLFTCAWVAGKDGRDARRAWL